MFSTQNMLSSGANSISYSGAVSCWSNPRPLTEATCVEVAMAVANHRPIRGPRKDITGRRFGRWSVLAFVGNSFWLCRCDCGAERTIRGPHLKSGHSQSCGCLKAERSSEALSAQLVGRKFGRLKVVERRGSNRRHNALWLCICECGKETTVESGKLLGGKTKSCGCLHRDVIRTHGKSRTRTYRIWMHMRQRCENPTDPVQWANYGGRGIKVCKRWRSYENFLADMGEAPAGMTLDRIDNDGNYKPGNCRWATRHEQLNNTRRNKFVTINGERVGLTAAIDMLRKMATGSRG